MPLPGPEAAIPIGAAASLDDHAMPAFEGAASRRHQRRPVRRIRREAWLHALRHARALAGARTFVQFAGWPRSGHSLIGALIDAHPRAAIAHELDAMGLFHKGVPATQLPALCLANARDFTRAGRYWNGFSYAVPGAPHGPRPQLSVIGDKKGDWATRWSAADPDLATRLALASKLETRWILVTRHPEDNVATMTLRQGRHYDRLRIAARGATSEAIRAAQLDGQIPAAVDDAMITDYQALAAATAALKTRVPAGNWHEIPYERFTAAPEAELERLAAFLGLDPDPAWRDAAARLVSPSGTQSRARLSWTADQRKELAKTIAEYDFLAAYREGT
ncbi:hypothetical protein OCH239_15625 [Roseivivax halodurans JCM 10272]|uniref:Sulfotransferase n=1 Tax=Roseivivax halodurans JCM 10272 TaxID=1449350 RepID=X7ECL3_9RHOB|nr:sulfotransferase [Roseivivax halodurans]ETX12853.1 hypothetical protein OCH239_15625 [Roseivivax halodurans JCM 10272]